ncbi:NAD-dependent epimerase/dehydratase family protein [Aureliella helgolandensis]|uniref:3 beta-hydroxysteroid dehydrogenase/Delta 5-->4-isomerase n=1 Tax=Aureliella helgolandensis TaxID=2527968 RepID=A0A518G0E5_9BACT|nr:NAD-dependent epimerase/dehydratase family protein [Aureliella helgolandensis]QDV22010.1 3 beta-hydroxysteroid dehydrogenase/Delta 5-->4-isomerase [Aureliella helgolandensis]
MAKILVTGYGGFLGAAVARQLLRAGYEVRGLARANYPRLASLGVECLEGDVTDRAVVLQAVQGCAGVVHTAAKAGVWGAWQDYYRVNTLATSHLLEAAHRHGVRAFVHTSSPSVTFAGEHQSGVDESAPYPKKWLCFYPHTKALAEQAVLSAAKIGQVRTCALRPHLIWGEHDPHLFPRVIARAKQGKLRRVGSGKNLIDVVHVESAAGAHVQAINRLLDDDPRLNGQALFLTDGQPVECWEWISKILSTAGVPVPTRSISYSAAYGIGAILEAIYWGLKRKQEPPMTRFVAAQLALDHYFNIDRARNLLDYQPERDVEAEFEKCRPWLQRLATA